MKSAISDETLLRDEAAEPVTEKKSKNPIRKPLAFAGIVALLFFSGFLACGISCFIQYREYHAEHVAATPDGVPLLICYSPGDTSARAAANYLAYTVEQTLGIESELVPNLDEEAWCIRILCGTEIPAPEQKATIEFVTTAEAAETAAGILEDEIYSLCLEDNGVRILVPEREKCFGAVKAISDRWLQTDCGITGDGELVISQAIIDEQLTGLQTEITGHVRILTQNLRCQDDGEGKTVEERAKRFFRLVEDYQPDLIGTQEATWMWMQLLEDGLSDRYELFGCSRLGPDTHDEEWNTILYRKDRFHFINGNTFWLSNTPSKAASKLNYEGAVRICTWTLLQDTETGKTLLFSNTHLQNTISDGRFYQDIRLRQIEILLQKLRSNGNMLATYPGFLTGDFNGDSREPFYSALSGVYEDAQTTAITDHSKIHYSFHDYGTVKRMIDFCFHSPKNTTVLDYRILDDWYDGYVSDHYGILITAVLN